MEGNGARPGQGVAVHRAATGGDGSIGGKCSNRSIASDKVGLLCMLNFYDRPNDLEVFCRRVEQHSGLRFPVR